MKPEKNGDIEDPKFILEALQALLRDQLEFPIKVEGTSTLPYTSVVQALNPGDGGIILKLVRPLPHELLEGAIFRAVFPVDEQRFQCLITFRGRHEYLQYRFDYPKVLNFADRRRHKRYPFRPRERAYVVGQDGGIPGMGIAGPLANVSMGGFALRLDRVLKLDDNMRIPPNLAVIDRGKHFSRIRIQDLPRLPLLEWRAHVSHCTVHNGEIILGFSFASMPAAMEASLNESFAFRDKMRRASVAPAGAGSPGAKKARPSGPEAMATSSEELDGPLLTLHRRSTRIVLLMADETACKPLTQYMEANGYLRIEKVASMDDLRAQLNSGDLANVHLILADAALAEHSEDPDLGLAALEQHLTQLGSWPIGILSENLDNEIMLMTGARTRILGRNPSEKDSNGNTWIEALDALAGFGREEIEP